MNGGVKSLIPLLKGNPMHEALAYFFVEIINVIYSTMSR